jgi:hypothetical protein
MSRAFVANRTERPAHEPLYAIEPQSGATIEVFHCDHVLSQSFGMRGIGFYWWACRAGCLPTEPHGPFDSAYLAYWDALGGGSQVFGKRARFAVFSRASAVQMS